MTVELITGVLVLILGLATAGISILGAAGLLGVVRFPRCAQCGRLGVVAAANPAPACVHCQHERLLHPMAMRHRVHPSHVPHA